MQHKNQHFIPSSYLSAWCDPDTVPEQEPYVWIFTKKGEKSRRKAPQNIFCETDTYTIKTEDGSRNLVLEKGLAELEGKFVNIRDAIIKKADLNIKEHFALCAFVAAMIARTKAQREHQSSQWADMLRFMDKMIEIKRKESPDAHIVLDEGPRNIQNDRKTFSYTQIKELSEKPLQNLLLPLISALIPFVLKMDYAFFTTDNRPGFITSDNPCAWFDSEWHKLPPILQNQVSFRKTTEISLPISPYLLLCLNFRGMKGHMTTNDLIVNEANARTRFNALEYFVVNKNIKKDEWFTE